MYWVSTHTSSHCGDHYCDCVMPLQISRLPLKIETMGQVKRKTELEAKLKEIEDAIEIFSKDKVYIAEDS